MTGEIHVHMSCKCGRNLDGWVDSDSDSLTCRCGRAYQLSVEPRYGGYFSRLVGHITAEIINNFKVTLTEFRNTYACRLADLNRALTDMVVSPSLYEKTKQYGQIVSFCEDAIGVCNTHLQMLESEENDGKE